MAFFTELDKQFYSLYGNTKTLNSQCNLEKEEQSWENQVPWLPTIATNSSKQYGTGTKGEA